MVVGAVDTQREVDGVVAHRGRHRDRIGVEEVAAAVDEIDDLQNGGLADRVLCLVGTFDDVKPSMEFDDRAVLAVALEGWGPESSEHGRSPLGQYRTECAQGEQECEGIDHVLSRQLPL